MAKVSLCYRPDEFKEGSARVALVGFQVGQVALNIATAQWVVFLQDDWTPKLIHQAEARALRMGNDTGKGGHQQHVLNTSSFNRKQQPLAWINIWLIFLFIDVYFFAVIHSQ